jgi:hypothetical protein
MVILLGIASSGTRVSLFRSFLIFASKRNEAKRILFRFIFACFCEKKNNFFASFRIVLLRFFFAISLQPFRFKTKNSFFRYFPSTFSLLNSAADPDSVGSRSFRSYQDPGSQCCRSGFVRIRNFLPDPDL